MKYLGIDFGTKRIGLAVSDDAGRVAFPHAVIPNDHTTYDAIKRIGTEKNISHIVLGESKAATGEDNAVMADIRICKSMLEQLGFTVHYMSESLSSIEAARVQGNNMPPQLLDAAAAAIILQRFLETH